MIETLDDIVEQLADKLGVYGSHTEACSEARPCRVCWTSGLKARIRRAVEIDAALESKGL